MPERLEAALERAGVPLTLHRREGYDHSYYFISTFIENHLRFHARYLQPANGKYRGRNIYLFDRPGLLTERY